MMEDTKNTKDDNKENESPELKEELTEDELKGLSEGLHDGTTGPKGVIGPGIMPPVNRRD